MKKVLVFGTFDLLHPGHLDFLRQARACGDELFAVAARDANVERIKGRRPEWDEAKRLMALSRVEIVDQALLGNEKMSYNIILELKPDVICLGYDQVADIELINRIFSGEIIRLKPYQEHRYKSSKLISDPQSASNL